MSAPNQIQSPYPAGNQSPEGGQAYSNNASLSQVPAGPSGYPNVPYPPQDSPGGYGSQSQSQSQSQPQSPVFQSNPNIQPQHPTPQSDAYQQYMPPQSPPPQTMSPPIEQTSPPQQSPPPQTVSPISPLTQQTSHTQHMPRAQQMRPPQQATWRRFIIPTNGGSISSGFPFHQQLYNLQMNHDEWHHFTAEIVEAAKLTASEDAAAWSAGASVGVVSSAFLFLFGPPIGYYTGKAVHKKTVIKKVKERLLEDGDIRAVLNKWNQRNFKWKGFQVWLECPSNYTETTPGTPKHQLKAEKKEAQKFKLVVSPNTEINEPHSAAPWSQMQSEPVEGPGAQPKRPVELQNTSSHDGLVEAPSAQPQQPVELHNTSARDVYAQNEASKVDSSTSVSPLSAASELDARDALHGNQAMPAELSG